MLENKEYNKIVILDDKGNDIGVETYPTAVEKGLIRSAARVMLVNEFDEVLISRRSKFISDPFLLDGSAGGHRDEGESYLQAAYRELEEELAITDIPLVKVSGLVTEKNIMCAVYVGKIASDRPIEFNPHEVFEVMWMSMNEVEQSLKENQTDFSPGFIKGWPQFANKLLQ